ncbi:MAG: flagellar basal-body rod protein FlgF [Usitatibacteraceae bacterium]
MDRLAYLASAGAKQLLHRQETIAHNLANANTTGFRADLDAFRAVPVQGPGQGTRVFVAESTPGFDSTPGALQATGRNLDVAIEGDGYLVVEARDGGEALTRAGSLEVGTDGTLRTNTGLAVQGDGGPITVPENSRLMIGRDGTVSAVAAGNSKSVNVVGRIKLVNPPAASLVKGGDGLLRTNDGSAPAADPAVKLVDGTLEGSNVNMVDALVGMISVARQFETQMRLMSTAEQNSRDANKLLSANG